MAGRGEGAPPEPKDLHRSCSWIPTTPGKPNSATQHLICGNWQTNDPCGPSVMKSGACSLLPRDYAENTPGKPNSATQHLICGNWQTNDPSGPSVMKSGACSLLPRDYAENTPACYNSADPVDVSMRPNNWQAAWQESQSADPHVGRDIFHKPKEMPIKDTDNFNMSFQTLLALPDSGVNQVAIENTLTDSVDTSNCSSDPCFKNRDELEGQVNLSKETFGAGMDIASVPTGVSSFQCRPPFDLNSPSRMMSTDAAFCNNSSFQFKPITTQKINKGEYLQESTTGNDAKNNNIPGDTGTELRGNKEKSNSIMDQSSTATLAQLQENRKPDKGSMEEVDFTKTPQKKARRRKHQPNVIIEGQKKSISKSSANTPSVPQETTRVKRKYVRKKGVTNPSVAEINGIGSNNKEVSSKDAATGKRKYTRREGGNKAGVDLDKDTTRAAEVMGGRRTRNSCRRSLNFNSDYQLGAENSSCSMNKLQEDNSSNMDPLKDTMPGGDQTLHARGKCQMVFSNETHDQEKNTVQVRMNPDSQRRPKSLGGSICSSACLTPEKKVSGLKRQSMGTAAELESCNRNEAETLNSFMQACLPIFSQNADRNNGSPGVHFPTIYKKKRTEKGPNMEASSPQPTGPTKENHVRLNIHSLRGSITSQIESVTNQGSASGQCQVTNLLRTNPEIDGTQNGRKIFEDLQALGPTEKIRKTRTKGPTQLQDLASLLEVCGKLPESTSGVTTTSCMRQNNAFLHDPPTCMETLVSNTNATMGTKKRSKKSMLINSAVPNLYNHQKSATTSMGPPMALTLTYTSHVDSIVEQLSQLDQNAKSSQASAEKWNAFMSDSTHYLEQHALVPYHRSGEVVPFDGSFDKVRKRIPRPKVNLDDETTRVWRLLLENINSEGIDGTNEEKTKWWEEERRVFNGRADSFIARMHLVQGDRRFSPWKGSVVDSIVGVFLTQNVSDHLSSSAFMSMAARFPLKSKTEPAGLHEEELDTEEVCGFNCGPDPDRTFRLNNNILNQSVCGEDTKMRRDFEGDNIRKVNSTNPSGNSFDGFILKKMLGCQSPNTSKNGKVMSHETTASKSVSLIEDGGEAEDTLSSQTPEISSQYSSDSPIAQTTKRSDYCLPSTTEEPTAGADTNRFNKSTSFVKVLKIASTGTVLHGVYEGSDKTNSDENRKIQSERSALDLQNEGHLDNTIFLAENVAPNSKFTLCHVPNSGLQGTECDLSKQDSKFVNSSSNKELCSADIRELSSESASGTTFQKITDVSFESVPKSSSTQATSSHNDQGEIQQKGQVPARSFSSSSNMNNFKNPKHKEVNSSKNGPENYRGTPVDEPKAKAGRTRKEKENQVDWEHMRKQTLIGGTRRAKTANTMDSADWDAVRCADVNEIAQTIKERGMNNKLAERIKDFLNRIVRDHGSIDLEWLRDVPPDKAKEYLSSIMGLGLKSVECVRLLTLHHLAFPVDTNVGRIAVRLGWVPLQPLPESLQLHLVEMYPVLESIQKYLWPRLCKLDQRTLYELHYQMITFGKVFCTKTKPNCNACPMKGECRHFASAFASARLSLPAPAEKGRATENREADQIPVRRINTLQLPSPEANQMTGKYKDSNSHPIIEEPPSPQPIYELPVTPEQVYTEVSQCDIESAFNEDPDEIPTIQLNTEEFTHNLKKIMQQNTERQEGDMSKALVALTSESASIPVPKLKNVNRLRTEHHVYELPDSHHLLEGMDKREPDDPCPYLLAIWTPGETVHSIEPPERRCSSHEFEKLCTDEACSSCNSIREDNSQTVRGTLLIPCRTAMRGSFPLNGTYFQVNEVFSDHDSSMSPINVPRQWLWNLRRRTVYFGTSIPTIFKGMTTEEIQYCFWRGFVCIRGFDRKTRAPRPLVARMHFPASKLAKGKGKRDKNKTRA